MTQVRRVEASLAEPENERQDGWEFLPILASFAESWT